MKGDGDGDGGADDENQDGADGVGASSSGAQAVLALPGGLVYTPADPGFQHLGMIFETDGRVVTSFRAGLAGPVS